jgi:hypothetical protein
MCVVLSPLIEKTVENSDQRLATQQVSGEAAKARHPHQDKSRRFGNGDNSNDTLSMPMFPGVAGLETNFAR